MERDIKVKADKKLKEIEIHIGNEGEKSVDNPNFFVLKNDTSLGSGGYGSVLKLVDSNKKVALAIKITEQNDEELIADALLQSDCNVLKMKFIDEVEFDTDSKIVYFMELAEGDLESFFKNHKEEINRNPQIFLNILESIRKQLLCIIKIGNKVAEEGIFDGNYTYTDMKLANILYKCDNSKNLNDVRFMIGDLGGAVPDRDKDFLATFPPYKFKEGRGFFKLQTQEDKLQASAWGLGILALFCYSYHDSASKRLRQTIFSWLFYKEIKDTTNEVMKYFIKQLNNFGNILQPLTPRPNLGLILASYFNNNLDNSINLSLTSND